MEKHVAETNEALQSTLQSLPESDVHELIQAQEYGDGAGILKGLSRAYGPLEEVHFLTSAPDCCSLLGFQGKEFVHVGRGSFFSILTFGYGGQGPSAFTDLLEAAGFQSTDASTIEAPCILKRSGTVIGGKRSGAEVIWDNDTRSAIPGDVSDG